MTDRSRAGLGNATHRAADLGAQRRRRLAIGLLLVSIVLAGAGLVHAEKVGREQRYTVVAAPLEDAATWMASVGSAWDKRLAKLAERHTGGAARGAPR